MKIKKDFLIPVLTIVKATVATLFGYAAETTKSMLDITYAFDENAIYWPNTKSFKLMP
jgi:hypothetical protein